MAVSLRRFVCQNVCKEIMNNMINVNIDVIINAKTNVVKRKNVVDVIKIKNVIAKELGGGMEFVKIKLIIKLPINI